MSENVPGKGLYGNYGKAMGLGILGMPVEKLKETERIARFYEIEGRWKWQKCQFLGMCVRKCQKWQKLRDQVSGLLAFSTRRGGPGSAGAWRAICYHVSS